MAEALFVDWDKATKSKAFQCILYPLEQKWRVKVLFDDVDLFKCRRLMDRFAKANNDYAGFNTPSVKPVGYINGTHVVFSDPQTYEIRKHSMTDIIELV